MKLASFSHGLHQLVFNFFFLLFLLLVFLFSFFCLGHSAEHTSLFKILDHVRILVCDFCKLLLCLDFICDIFLQIQVQVPALVTELHLYMPMEISNDYHINLRHSPNGLLESLSFKLR